MIFLDLMFLEVLFLFIAMRRFDKGKGVCYQLVFVKKNDINEFYLD